jgi:hypothetical protein
MKQRGKRSNSKLVHVSFDEVERFVPRVPKQICPDEDNTTPRICVAPNILSAIQAMPQGGTVAYNMARIGVPVVIHAYYIESDAILMPEQIADKVPDAVATGEMWVMENKPDISYRTFMSNMDDELLKSFHVELQEVWE